MKKTLAVGLFLLLCIFNLSAQDQDNEGQTASFPQLVLYPEKYLQFNLVDGTSLKYDEFKEKVGVIPENEKLLRRIDGWRIAQWVNLAVTFGFTAGYLYCVINSDAPYADGVRSAWFPFIILSYGFQELTGVAMQKNITRAINNYNLSVMGIPIPVK
jgi:hypothetical protein